jgi:hypothetical protein
MKTKENEYYKLRDHWKEYFKNGSLSEEIRHVATMVKKDVLRTDRTPVQQKICTHPVHQGTKAQVSLCFIFLYNKQRRSNVTHSLTI